MRHDSGGHVQIRNRSAVAMTSNSQAVDAASRIVGWNPATETTFGHHPRPRLRPWPRRPDFVLRPASTSLTSKHAQTSIQYLNSKTRSSAQGREVSCRGR